MKKFKTIVKEVKEVKVTKVIPKKKVVKEEEKEVEEGGYNV